uniref:Uncharacterized protein n=1 Tax=Homalodisca liturata TaxID=320908 RepID=A0A1B6HTV1_9HEMI
MSVLVLLSICLYHVKAYPSEYTSRNNISTENVSNIETTQETHISYESKVTNTTSYPETINTTSEGKNNNATSYDYVESENSTEVHIYPYTDKDGLVDVVADNGIRYESSASDNFVLPGHDDDDGNFAGITDDSEPMHYYISEEGNLSGGSDDIGIEVLLPDYVKPTRSSDDDEIADSGQATTVDEDLIIPDSVETTTMPTTEATTWFYHSWEFRGENFEIKEDEITTIRPAEQEYTDEEEQISDFNTHRKQNYSKQFTIKSDKLNNQPIKEDEYEQEAISEDTDDGVDYKNLMADDSHSLEQITTDTTINRKNMKKYVISFNEDPVELISPNLFNNKSSKEKTDSKSSHQNSGSLESVTMSTDDFKPEKNQRFSKRTKRENEELESTYKEEGKDEQEQVTQNVIPETTRIWNWPTHSWENHGDMYEPSSPDMSMEVPQNNGTRSVEEMEYSEEDISVGARAMSNEIYVSEKHNPCEYKFNKSPKSFLFDLNKGKSNISGSKKTHSSPTEESQYDDVTQPNFSNFDGGRPSELHAVNKNGNYFMKNIGSQELFIPPTCLIEWENCKMDGDCCRPFFCSTLPRFPVIENMNESSTLQIDQFCSRFQLNVLLDWKTNNRKDLQKIIDSYKRKILRVIKS